MRRSQAIVCASGYTDRRDGQDGRRMAPAASDLTIPACRALASAACISGKLINAGQMVQPDGLVQVLQALPYRLLWRTQGRRRHEGGDDLGRIGMAFDAI